jgi:2-polyprenyl-3-methyl-5-hydroxy-6-metoxy-1,4-benzoquinol methylase
MTMADESVMRGGCLCGAVRYAYSGVLGPIALCHCRQCRKAQGSAFAANSAVAAAAFDIVSGQDLIREFESSPGKKRAFCVRCGSPLYSRRDDRPEVRRLRLGTLDTPIDARPACHIFADSGAEWFAITDALPRHADVEPGRGVADEPAAGDDPVARTARSWVDNAGLWTAAVRGGAIESRRVATDQALLDAILARRPGRVLDLGCGEGWLVRALDGHGIDAVGVDGFAALIDAARASGAGNYHVCSFGELADHPIRAGRGFDVVAANFALLDDRPLPLLRGLRDALAPGAAVIIQTVHPWFAAGEYRDGWREEDFRGVAGQGDWRPMPWYRRTLASWMEVLRESGYAVVDLREPSHPETGTPLSLLMVAEPFGDGKP